MTLPPRVSVAVPLCNEEANTPELLRRLTAALDATPGGPHEMVFVDDGSSDRTLELLEAAGRRDNRIVVVSLSRNFGHQAAITAALDQVTGDVTVVMDGDLQDPPETIPLFLEQYAQGHEVVYARRVNRDAPWWLRVCYFLFYRLAAGLSPLRLPLDAGDFGLLGRRVVDALRKAPERHRYLRGLRAWAGFRQTGVPVERPDRVAGTSKYGFRRLLALAFDGIFAFSTVPLRAATVLGAIAIGLSGAFALYSLYAKLFQVQTPRGFTALVFIITFLFGVNLFFLGVIGEYVGRVYEEVKARPIYVVARVIKNA